MHDHLLSAKAARRSARSLRLPDFGSSLGMRITAWITTAAGYYEAAATYEQLSRLSDAELHRRELSRATLARDVCQACDSTMGR
jgi:hypothetical protein